MLLSFLVAPGAMLAVGLADSVAWIAVGTAVLGFFTDLYRPAVSAAITDIVPSADRPRAFGYLYWAINVGAAIAPVAAGLLARTNYLLLFVGDALTTFLFGLIVLWGVRETRPAELEGRLSTPVGERVRALWAEPVLLAFTGLALLFGTIYAQGHVTLPVDMSAHGLTPEQYGLAVALNGALIVVLGIPASNAAPRWPRFGALAIAGLLLGIGFGLPAIVTTFGGYALSVGIWTLGEIIGATVAPSVVADLAPIDKRGLYQGVFGAAWGLAFFTGPVLGGWIYQDAWRHGPLGGLSDGGRSALCRLPGAWSRGPAADGAGLGRAPEDFGVEAQEKSGRQAIAGSGSASGTASETRRLPGPCVQHEEAGDGDRRQDAAQVPDPVGVVVVEDDAGAPRPNGRPRSPTTIRRWPYSGRACPRAPDAETSAWAVGMTTISPKVMTSHRRGEKPQRRHEAVQRESDHVEGGADRHQRHRAIRPQAARQPELEDRQRSTAFMLIRQPYPVGSTPCSSSRKTDSVEYICM